MGDEERVLRRLLDVTAQVAGERRTEPMLRVILAAARELAGARYAAVGVPDGDGGFALFLTDGVDDATWDAIGALPRTHGLLGALLADPAVIRLPDLREDPRFGWYPSHHPQMTSFLGVPIRVGGEVLAELYLTDKEGAPEFTEEDERVVGMLAAHAALAVANAQRTERTRELSAAAERARLARELHDSVTQTLFSLSLAASSGPDQLDRVQELAAAALAELHEVVEALRPESGPDVGLADALRTRVALLGRVHEVPIELRISGPVQRAVPSVRHEVLRIAGEALSNAVQHSAASSISVRLHAGGGTVELAVADDGHGFDPAAAARSGRLGLTGMRERADALGGVLRVSTSSAGTTVELAAPDGR